MACRAVARADAVDHWLSLHHAIARLLQDADDALVERVANRTSAFFDLRQDPAS
jgi:hypothetical protein